MRRRTFLASLGAAGVLTTLPLDSRRSAAGLRAAPRTVAREILHETPALGAGSLLRESAPAGSLGAAVGSTGEPVLAFTSAVIAAGQVFDRVGARWFTRDAASGRALRVEVRTSADAADWSDWRELERAPELDDDAALGFYAMPRVVARAARHAQYRLWLTDGSADTVQRFGLTFLDVIGLNDGSFARLASELSRALRGTPYAEAAPVGAPKVLTRRDWGADESRMQWTPQYKRPHTKAVIHHTVTGDGGSNVAAELRSIYYFHAVTRGWGDIGYQYLVDKFGNIWQGRQGGDNVEGGHAYGWNNGTFAVSSIGDYSVTQPTSALQGAIANIIALRFKQNGIVPYGADVFTHQEQRSDGTWVDVTTSSPNILGHRDANYKVGQNGGQTACPGNTIANMMDGLRRLTQAAYDNGYTNLVRLDPALPRGTFPGSALTVPVTVANRGTTAIPAGTAVSYQIQTPAGAAIVPQGGKGVLSAPLLPNGTTVVQVPFSGPPAGSYIVRWDLHTGAAWWNNVFNTPVRDQWLFSRDWGADWLSDTIPSALAAGEVRTIQATILNDGGRTWPATGLNPVKVGYSWRSAATGNIIQGTRTSLPYDVQPGQTVTVSIQVTAPEYPTTYVLRLDLVKENEFSFGDKGIAPDESTTTVLLDAKATISAGAVPKLDAGQTATVPVTITNTGRGTFPISSSTPVRLSYHWYDATGKTLVYEGARTMLPADLLAGQSVTVNASVTAPNVGGTLTLKWDLVQEGVAWLSTKGVATANQQVVVTGPVVKSYAASYQPQVLALAAVGAQTGVPMVLVNTSNFTWPASGANPIRLSYHWWSLTTNKTELWEGPRTLLSADVPPGGSVSVSGTVQFPATAGPYLLRWDLVEEGVSWFSGRGVATGDQFVRVETPPPPGAFVYGSSMLPSTPATVAAGATASVPVRVQNLGATTWDSSINLSYHWLDSSGRTVTWEGRRTSLSGTAPNGLIDVTAQVVAPATPGTYTLVWDIVREGYAWYSSQGVQMPRATVTVAAAAATPPPATGGTYGASYAPQVQSVSAAPGATVNVPVMLVSSSSFAWTPGTVNLAYHLANPATGGIVVWDGLRTALASAVAPNTLANVQIAVKAPQTPGTYTIRLDLVHEGVAWFSDKGVPMGSVTLVVQ